MAKKVIFVFSRPSSDDKNLFAFHLRRKFSKNGKGICVQMSEKSGIPTLRVARALKGKSILISEAHALSKVLGFEQRELFFKKRAPSRKQRSRKKRMLTQT